MPKESVLLKKIRACTTCRDVLPVEPRPVVSFSASSKVVIIGQAPGSRVHESGTPWDDPSGDRLRDWLGVSSEQFYDPKRFGLVPMGFCYPGKGKSGDLPPRPECAAQWMSPVLKALKNKELILLVGQYSQAYFLKDQRKENLTATVRAWKSYLPEFFVLPHPSPRNNIWMKKNLWFARQVLPDLKRQMRRIF